MITYMNYRNEFPIKALGFSSFSLFRIRISRVAVVGVAMTFPTSVGGCSFPPLAVSISSEETQRNAAAAGSLPTARESLQ